MENSSSLAPAPASPAPAVPAPAEAASPAVKAPAPAQEAGGLPAAPKAPPEGSPEAQALPPQLAAFAEAQLEELQRACPGADLSAETDLEALGALWAKTGSLRDAWRLTHFDELLAAAAASARQAAYNELRAAPAPLPGAGAAPQPQVSESAVQTLAAMLPGTPRGELRRMLAATPSAALEA